MTISIDWLLFALPAIYAITVHEVAHGWVAHRLGDDTAKNEGRLSLNPLKHVDLVGTVLVPAVLYFFFGFLFGWAKPVPVDWHNLRNPRRDMALVALAGPGANLCMLIFWFGAWQLTMATTMGIGFAPRALIYMCGAGIIVNTIIMALNLIPIPPLDGSRVVTAVLPAKAAYHYNRFGRLGILLVLGLVLTGGLNDIVRPILVLVQRLLGSF